MQAIRIAVLFLLCGHIVYTTTQLVPRRGKWYYVSEIKTDFVTSQEMCTSHSGHLVHVDNNLNPLLLRNDLRLPENESYWLEGGGPSYVITTSCLLLSRTIMAVGCNQKHFFICEIKPSSVFHAISPSRSKDYVNTLFSNDLELRPSSDVSWLEQTSQLSHLETTASYLDVKHSQELGPATSLSTMLTLQHILPSLTHKVASETQSVVGMHTVVTMTPSGACAHMAETGSGSSMSEFCYRYCSSKNFSGIFHVDKLTTKTSPAENNSLDDTFRVNVKETSRAIRKLTSVWDSRASSKTIGVFAITIITAVPLCVFLMDLPVFLKCMKSKLKLIG